MTVVNDPKAASGVVDSSEDHSDEETTVYDLPDVDPNPYARLAWLVDEYMRKATKEAALDLESFLGRYGSMEFFRGKRDEQLRSFCELACTDYPTELLDRFDEDFLLDIERDYMHEKKKYGERLSREKRIDKILYWIGFERVIMPPLGRTSYISQLEEAKRTLSRERPTSQEVDGCAINSINNTVALLKMMISFYGRYLLDDMKYLDKLISLLKLDEKGSPRASELRKSLANPDYRLDLSTYIQLIERLNTFLNAEDGRALGDKCERDFHHRCLLQERHIELLKQVVPERRYFAHDDELSGSISSKAKREKAQQIVECLLGFSIGLENFFPPIIIMKRKLINDRGEVRVDYVDESGALRYDRFIKDLVPFFPSKPAYYWREGDIDDGVFLQAPICIPVVELPSEVE